MQTALVECQVECQIEHSVDYQVEYLAETSHQKVVESYDQSRSSTLQLNMLIQSTITNQIECHIKHTY